MQKCISDHKCYIFGSSHIANATYMVFYHVSFIHSLGKYVRKMVLMSQKRLCWNNGVTMATPQIFFSQPSILYPRHITESKKYGFALFYRGEGFTFFHPPDRCTTSAGLTSAHRLWCWPGICPLSYLGDDLTDHLVKSQSISHGLQKRKWCKRKVRINHSTYCQQSQFCQMQWRHRKPFWMASQWKQCYISPSSPYFILCC